MPLCFGKVATIAKPVPSMHPSTRTARQQHISSIKPTTLFQSVVRLLVFVNVNMLFDKASALLLASSNLLHPIKYQDDIIPQTPILSTYRRFDWDDTPANETLVYHDCFNGYHCAKLRVPMDWTVDKSEDNRTVEIAVIRLAATVPVTDSRYGGAVLLNPGGPGGSGVNMLLREGKSIRTITGAGPDADNTTARHFDIISFDPRGVNNTRPTFTCFPNYIERLIFELETQAYGVFDSSETAFTNYWTQIRTEADICSKRAIEEDIAEHMSTSNVVKDIVAIIERHGEWREKEARNLLRLSDNSDLSDSIKYHPGKELVQYMGFSYGTVLGATLADMFPDRVKRAVLDGVVDSFDYYQGGWLTNLQDTDLQIVKFGEYCWLGGPKNCPLYHADGPAVIVDRFSRIVQNLTSNPIGVPATSEHSADLATWSDLKQLFKSITYNPLTTFHSLAQILVQLEQGNGTALVQSRRSIKDKIKEGLSEECTRDGPYSSACVQHSAGFDDTISTAILCSDAEPQTNITREEYWKYAQKLMGQSKLIGDVWGIIRLRCTQVSHIILA